MADSPIYIWIERSATAIETLAVGIIVVVVLVGTLSFVVQIITRRADSTTFSTYRYSIGRALLLGLEILVAADVIRTVALEPTLQNVLILGLLVIIRTFLSWSLVLEIEDRWPWQARARPTSPELFRD